MQVKFADTGRTVKRLAVISGAGGSMFEDALAVGADCLLIFLLLGGFRWIFTIFRHENRQTRTESARRVGAWYWGHFLPYLILSVLSVLIYLLADILPRMLISYFRLWRMLTGGATIDDASIGG